VPKYSDSPTIHGPVFEISRPGLRPKSPEIVVPTPAALIDKYARTEKLAAVPRLGDDAAYTFGGEV
jgi:hypothetical protein